MICSFIYSLPFPMAPSSLQGQPKMRKAEGRGLFPHAKNVSYAGLVFVKSQLTKDLLKLFSPLWVGGGKWLFGSRKDDWSRLSAHIGKFPLLANFNASTNNNWELWPWGDINSAAIACLGIRGKKKHICHFFSPQRLMLQGGAHLRTLTK